MANQKSRKKVEIYSSKMCGYCHRAKSLLKQKGIDFDEIDVTFNPEKRREMERRAKGRTIPQILIGGKPVGGADDLYALEASGALDRMLGYG